MKLPVQPLSPTEVQVWRVDLTRATRHLAHLEQVLSPDESARASRFRFQADREHFVVARAALRHILSRFLELEPADIVFNYGAQGKPALHKENPHDLRFNLAHSHGLMLCALGRNRELGVDVERLRDGIDFEEIAESFFAPQEIITLQNMPAHLKKQAFFTCWTRKEAYVKACGQGLSLPLDQFTVPMSDAEPLRLNSESAPFEVAKWSLTNLPTEPGYAAALVVEGLEYTLTFRDWQGDRP